MLHYQPLKELYTAISFADEDVRAELPTAEAVVDNTIEWAEQFHQASGARVAAEPGGFSLDGASRLDETIPRPSLRITPRIYTVASYSPDPLTRGYLLHNPTPYDLFTPENDSAWHIDSQLWVDPTPMSFEEYKHAASEQDVLGRTVPELIVDRMKLQKHSGPPIRVLRALGVLPALKNLEVGAGFTYDLRLDVLLHNKEGVPAESYRQYNYANTVATSASLSKYFFNDTYRLSKSQRHVPPLDVLSTALFKARATKTGFLPPDDFNAGLLLTSNENKGISQPTIFVINLVGAAAVKSSKEG